MATEQKDAPSAQIESELAPPVAFAIIHSDESAVETLESAGLPDVEGAPDIEGAPGVEPEEANGAFPVEFQQDHRSIGEEDAPTASGGDKGLATELGPDFAAAGDGMAAVNVRVLQAFLANTETNFDFLTALPSVRSFSELIALQSKFVSKQVDAMARPAAEISVMTQKTMANAVDAMTSQITRSIRNSPLP
jgi:hypothetical protein